MSGHSQVWQILARRQFVMRRVEAQPHLYSPGFGPWLEKNLAVWEKFESLADQLWTAGRRHWSARTIWHVIRHETALAAEGDAPFKINNNWSRDVARLYLALKPERTGFFELRDSPTEKKSA